MNAIDYSVIIRTTGKANEKYKKLLNSISCLVPHPKEIIVVLPEGYEKPAEELGYETYYYSPKGMVIQRMTGIQKCKSKYALICDDDISFESDFVKKLYKPIRDGLCKLSVGPLYTFLPKGKAALLDLIMGSATPSVFHKNRYVSILKTTGYSYNKHLKREIEFYETQSAAWTCFFADIEALRSIRLEDEVWLDSHGYSALDDQTMFYKAHLRGLKTMVVVDAEYEHLDARTSTRNNKSAFFFSMTFNRVVFWRRFIYDLQKSSLSKMWCTICFKYRMCWLLLYNRILLVFKRINADEFQIIRQGYKAGRKYINSTEFQELNPVC